MRTRSLHAWLALALSTVVVVPALVGAGAWLGVSAWQSDREKHRLAQATDALRGQSLFDDAGRTRIANRLAQLGVEAQLGPAMSDDDRVPPGRRVRSVAVSAAGTGECV
jgi:hypothetical protein